jgi:hypothetical protein
VEDSNGNSRKLLRRLHELMLDESSLHFSDFIEVAETFIASYSKFTRRGIPGPTIGVAMLGATVNVYEMFGMTEDLPNLLRLIADQI